jgi:hypothetical protein
MEWQLNHIDSRMQVEVRTSVEARLEVKNPLKVVTLSKEEMMRKLGAGFFKGMKLCAYNPADNSLKKVQI